MKSKKGTELPLNLVVVAIIILVVLFIVILIFTGFGNQLFGKLKEIAGLSASQASDLPVP